MKQAQFEAAHAALWEDVDAILEQRSLSEAALPALYRRLCQCLALAQQRGYSPALTAQLQQRVAACHARLYGVGAERPRTLLSWLLLDFPRTVRAEWPLLVLALLAFWGVALAVGVLVYQHPQWAYSFAEPEQLRRYSEMYSPKHAAFGRGGDEGDVQMFGVYIWNNVSICFRTFAAGIFGGIPALLVTGYNGLHGGVIGAWLARDPSTASTFWPFVVTHSSFEITGLVLSSQAGMRLGLALIRPGRMSRRHAVFAASQRMFPVMLGAACMTALAAFFEAFWSASSTIPAAAKFSVGGLCWALVLGFFIFAGRSHAAR